MKLRFSKFIRNIFFLSTLSFFTGSQAKETFIAPEQNDSDFEVFVKDNAGIWKRIPVYPVKVDEVKDTRHNVRIASMSTFDMDGKSLVKVVSKRHQVKTVKNLWPRRDSS